MIHRLERTSRHRLTHLLCLDRWSVALGNGEQSEPFQQHALGAACREVPSRFSAVRIRVEWKSEGL